MSQGLSLAIKLTREGRAMNAGVYFCTQNAKDLLDERIKNNIGMFFIFKSNDTEEIKNSLKLLGADPEDEGNEGINIQEIARRLGHSKIEVTWNTYSHLYPREEERAIEILNSIRG